MRSWLRVGLIATLAFSPVYGCDEDEDEGAPRGRGQEFDEDELLDEDIDEYFDGLDDDLDEPAPGDAGTAPLPAPGAPQGGAQSPSVPSGTPRSAVPSELVGTWHDGAFDFALWESYREGYWAGRNAAPSREAMVFRQDGSAKFYRYEFAFGLYEELIDCEGTVAFHGDGTFTFHPVRGRKRFYDSRHREKNVDRALTAAELAAPKLAGKRAYNLVAGSSPATVQITVPSSAPYRWYKAG